LAQVSRYAHIRKVTITSAKCRTELDFYLTGSVKRGDVEAGCSEARTHLDVESDDPVDQVAEVVRLAHTGCFLEQMIARPVPVRSTLTVNGTEIPDGRG
jgi:hypothetical protein